MAANVGGPVITSYKTFDVDLPDVEALLNAGGSTGNSFSYNVLVGAEIVAALKSEGRNNEAEAIRERDEALERAEAAEKRVKELEELIDGENCADPDKIDALFRRAEAAESSNKLLSERVAVLETALGKSNEKVRAIICAAIMALPLSEKGDHE
jgi:hypothetical protein